MSNRRATPAESGECRRCGVERHADLQRQGHRTGGVAYVVDAAQRQIHRAQALTSAFDHEAVRTVVGHDVDGAHVGPLAGAVGERTAIPVRGGEAPAHRVVDAQHLGPGDLREVVDRSSARSPRTIRSGRGGRPRRSSASCPERQLEVGAVALVGLHHQPLATGPLRAGTGVGDVATDHEARVGARASARIIISIDVVVVLPCVPATASDLACAQIEASIPARRSVVTPADACLVELDVRARARRCCR